MAGYKIKNILHKVQPALNKTGMEIVLRPFQPKVVEHLISFLKLFWVYMPDKLLQYLERIAEEKQYSIYNVAIKDGSMNILQGMIQMKTITKHRREKCLNILDAFAMAGWDEA